MAKKDLAKTILSDLKVELLDEFTKNFERKAFFDEPWGKRKRDGRGSLLLVDGRLRRSIRATQSKRSILFFSDCEYADIHNGGGVINVSPKMRKYFWYRYMQVKTPENPIPANGSDAEFWSRMARAKKITIPARQYIGNHKNVLKIAQTVANDCTKEVVGDIFTEFAQKLSKQ